MSAPRAAVRPMKPDAALRSLARRLAAKSSPVPSGCIEWIGFRSRGYGVTSSRGVQIQAHRAAWILAHGPIPPGLFACHRCDNRACVNVEHLWLGTHAENMADRNNKGRQAKGARQWCFGVYGDKHPTCKITNAQVLEIRRRMAAGEKRRDVALLIGCAAATVTQIANGTRRSNG